MMIIFSKVLFWSLCNNFIRYFETIYWFISNFSHIKSVSKGKLKDGWYENRTSTRKISDSNVNIQLWISVILSCPPFLFFDFALIYLDIARSLPCLQSMFWNSNTANGIPLNLIRCSCWADVTSSKIIFRPCKISIYNRKKAYHVD